MEKHAKGEKANVVDIGTGSGLLSLLAAQAGADSVTAVEVFTPMAEVAEQIFKKNGYGEKIELLKSRSTDCQAQPTTSKGNIVVAEVFDTELIGEGALRTFKEAHGTLVEPNSRVIPQSARIWIMPVESAELQKFNRTPSKILKSPFEDCSGSPAVFDIQVSEVQESLKEFRRVGDPQIVFSFNFEDPESIVYNGSRTVEFSSKIDGSMDAVVMWWDLNMDGGSDNFISMAPNWIDKESPWRDHWMQAVYFLPKPISVKRDQPAALFCSHDEFSLWFCHIETPERPICTCQMHVICPRTAMYRLNDLEERRMDIIEKIYQVSSGKSVICVGEGTLFGLYAAKTAKHVKIVDANAHFRRILLEYKRVNGISNVDVCSSVEELDKDFELDILLGEPFLLSSLLPSDNFSFFNIVRKLRHKYQRNFEYFPKSMKLYAMPVRFQDLWKTVAPFETVQGFDLSIYNKVYQKAKQAADEAIDAQPLWEYPSIVTGEPVEVFKVQTEMVLTYTPSKRTMSSSQTVTIRPSAEGTNAIVFWAEVQFDDSLVMTSTTADQTPMSTPKWHRGHRQGVHFLPNPLRSKEIHIDISCRENNDFVPSFEFCYR
ncbi:ribosomal protein l11 methyltransferase (PrmA) domain-containing protein [Ditylenchus destructor]|nr:ribosomal protein l11 methyltransferase (PrmA) domain-containing protein [Ditylenchus destructor]